MAGTVGPRLRSGGCWKKSPNQPGERTNHIQLWVPTTERVDGVPNCSRTSMGRCHCGLRWSSLWGHDTCE
eukprot:1476113-Pyramimonas_sp.AAC.1